MPEQPILDPTDHDYLSRKKFMAHIDKFLNPLGFEVYEDHYLDIDEWQQGSFEVCFTIVQSEEQTTIQ